MDAHTIKDSFLVHLTHIASLLISFVLIQRLLRTYQPDLRNIPGPYLAKFTGLWNFRMALTGKMQFIQRDLHAKYGPVVRVTPNKVILSDPSHIPTIYGAGSKYNKSPFYSVFEVPNGFHDLFSVRSSDIHRNLKRNVSTAYSMSSVLTLEPLVDICMNLFMCQLEERTNSPIDLGAWLQWYAFDVIGYVTFSSSFGFLREAKDIRNFIRQIEIGLFYCSTKLVEIIPALRENHVFRNIELFAKSQISKHVLEKQDQDSGCKDFTARLLEKQQINPTLLSNAEILSHCTSNLLAGSDTTAISLRAVLYYLVKNPEKYKKLMDEIFNLDNQNKLSQCITFKESLDMPYLQACIKEAMRLHPVIGMPLERSVPRGGVTLSGHVIPEGVIVGMNAWVIHMDSKVFGPNPENFQPERWIERDAEDLKIMDRAFLTFGHGGRICIGKNISTLMMSKLIPQLFRKYKVKMAEPNGEWKFQNRWLVRQSNFITRFELRESEKTPKSAQDELL